jgi:hypothetical protein
MPRLSGPRSQHWQVDAGMPSSKDGVRRATTLLILVLGCGGRPAPYPSDVAENFLRACVGRGGSEASCRCALEKVEERYTLDAYRALEARIARGETPGDLAGVIAACQPRR